MFKTFMKFLQSNKNREVFTKEYRNGYNNLWINSLKDYTP